MEVSPPVRTDADPVTLHGDLGHLASWLHARLPVFGARARLLDEWHTEVSGGPGVQVVHVPYAGCGGQFAADLGEVESRGHGLQQHGDRRTQQDPGSGQDRQPDQRGGDGVGPLEPGEQYDQRGDRGGDGRERVTEHLEERGAHVSDSPWAARNSSTDIAMPAPAISAKTSIPTEATSGGSRNRCTAVTRIVIPMPKTSTALAVAASISARRKPNVCRSVAGRVASTTAMSAIGTPSESTARCAASASSASEPVHRPPNTSTPMTPTEMHSTVIGRRRCSVRLTTAGGRG